MGLVSRSKFREDVPYEEGAWIEFKLLTLGDLDKAKQVKSQKALALMARQQFSQQQIDAMRDAVKDKQTEPLDEFDAESLLASSIVAWSYPSVGDIEGIDAVQLLDPHDLDAKTARWAIDIILDRNGLAETETERKNGYKASTAPSTGKERPQTPK